MNKKTVLPKITKGITLSRSVIISFSHFDKKFIFQSNKFLYFYNELKKRLKIFIRFKL